MRSDKYPLPELFLERLQRIIPTQYLKAVMQTFTQPRPTTFRVNTLKSSAASVRQQLEEAAFKLTPVVWYKDAFILRQGYLRDLQGHFLYTSGSLYVQSLSSMLPPLVLDPQRGENILDLTAAPGSKTTQLACLMQNQGRIIANDNNRIRYYKLKANVEMQGVGNVELMLCYGETFGRSKPEAFDRVLLDAPCSAEGRFQISESASFRYWKPIKVREMAHKQKRLIASAIHTLRVGGLLVYSTCTFAPEENEAVIDWALRKFEGVMELETIALPVPHRLSGLKGWQERTFHPTLGKTVRILPTQEMEGFFIARLRKLKPILRTLS